MAEEKQPRRKWQDKILEADKIWAQVRQVLAQRGLELPGTLRRPDIRVILDNRSGLNQVFGNPAKHAGDKAESIPAAGDKTAAMIMVRGGTLAEQYSNAAKLAARYDLARQGLSVAFVNALHDGSALDLVSEAYGPAPFGEQAAKLVDVDWRDAEGKSAAIDPVVDGACAYGARAATTETAFRTRINLFIKGTSTTPEMIQNEGMVIAVSRDWQTKAVSTRPIVPSVAKEFYGAHYESIPVVEIHPDGFVQKIDLGNGTVIDFSPAASQAAPVLRNG